MQLFLNSILFKKNKKDAFSTKNVMKYSKYNHIIKEKDKNLLYNSNSNCLIELDNETLEKIDKFNLGKEELELLCAKKVFVENDDFELNRIKFETHAARANTKSLNLTIVPTYYCNFNCTYCYEKDRKNISWNNGTKEAIIDFIEKNKPKVLNITWYGGEPLLKIREIKSFIKQIELLKLKTNYSIITNGYLLNKENIAILKDCKINDIQVTIDGLEEMHNKKRPLLNGDETFKKIISNLQLLNTDYPSVTLMVRVNTDMQSKESFPKLYHYLKTILSIKRLHIYPGIITDEDSLTINNDCLLDRLEATKFRLWLIEKHNINIGLYPIDRNECMARLHNSFIFGPEGAMYKCWLDVGKLDKSIGNIIDNQITNLKDYYNYVEGADQFSDKECIACSLLPICAGGCPYTRLNNAYKGGDKDVCLYAKGYLSEFIKLHYNEKIK